DQKPLEVLGDLPGLESLLIAESRGVVSLPLQLARLVSGSIADGRYVLGYADVHGSLLLIALNAGFFSLLNQIMESSACNAPAALMAWRIPIRSRGVTPSRFSARTTSPMLAPSGMTVNRRDSSTTFNSVLGTTVVWPVVLKGDGWETCGASFITRERLPWETATVEIRTLSPITMVPVRSLSTTLAWASGLTSSVSREATNSTVRLE